MMTFLAATTDASTLTLSIAIGWLGAYVIVDLARRVRSGDRTTVYVWWLFGSIAGGSGLWAADFLQLHSRVLPIPLGYGGGMLTLSWLFAVATAAIALRLAMRVGAAGSIVGSVAIAVCLGAMHRTAFDAVELAPSVAWDVGLIAAALGLFFVAAIGGTLALGRLKTGGFVAVAVRAALSLWIASTLAGSYALSLAAARVPADAVCIVAATLDGDVLAHLIAATVPVLLICTIVGSAVYGLVDRRRSVLAGSLDDVAARLSSATDELRQRAMLDALTGLPNRLLFEDRLAQALLRAERAKKSVRGLREKLAVLFIDVDGFKAVNDSFGHAGGDDVLRQIGERLREAARNDDTVARIGSDQFLVLMEGATSSNDCVALASRILDALKAPLAVAERHVQVGLSIGVVVYPDHGEPGKLLAQAESAMQAAKRAGRSTYALFASHMHHDMADQLELVNDLRSAIELGQLSLHYQPKIDGRRHCICGVEALLRWQHPVRGFVSPSTFIPLAERFGLINALGNWVIDQACAQMAAWASDRMRMRVAINLSVHQLREPDLVARITQALARHRIDASQLLCEITESVAMQDITATQRTLDELGALGVYLSIDDFGTGYSSLSYLRQLPARQLKIDRTFINDLDTSDDAKAIVDGVVRLAHALGLRVVAEGVETASQRDILLALGCDELQGYFFAKPMTADKLVAWSLGHKPLDAVDFAASLLYRPVDA